MNQCDRCNIKCNYPLMNLCNQYPDLMVCRKCDTDYFSYRMRFLDEVRIHKDIRDGKYLKRIHFI